MNEMNSNWKELDSLIELISHRFFLHLFTRTKPVVVLFCCCCIYKIRSQIQLKRVIKKKSAALWFNQIKYKSLNSTHFIFCSTLAQSHLLKSKLTQFAFCTLVIFYYLFIHSFISCWYFKSKNYYLVVDSNACLNVRVCVFKLEV
jgi:hypothetical protein